MAITDTVELCTDHQDCRDQSSDVSHNQPPHPRTQLVIGVWNYPARRGALDGANEAGVIRACISDDPCCSSDLLGRRRVRMGAIVFTLWVILFWRGASGDGRLPERRAQEISLVFARAGVGVPCLENERRGHNSAVRDRSLLCACRLLARSGRPDSASIRPDCDPLERYCPAHGERQGKPIGRLGRSGAGSRSFFLLSDLREGFGSVLPSHVRATAESECRS